MTEPSAKDIMDVWADAMKNAHRRIAFIQDTTSGKEAEASADRARDYISTLHECTLITHDEFMTLEATINRALLDWRRKNEL